MHIFLSDIWVGSRPCALIRVLLHTKVAHGACKPCALIRVVHLSGVHLSGFRSCTKHSTKVRGMENVCTYLGFTVTVNY